MARIEAVAVALLALGEPAHPSVFAQGIEAFPPSGQEFMGIGLMSHIPYDLVLRQVQGQVQGHGQLHGAQIGAQMPSGNADFLDQKPPDLLRQKRVVFRVYFFDVVRLLYLFQKHTLPPSSLHSPADQRLHQPFQKTVALRKAAQRIQRFFGKPLHIPAGFFDSV